ncbi:MAG: hypothetical protein KDK39_03850 [Leptospiraceae bacterium]|nr:hypothetical protein [Leptospiraceae bacterium]
MSRQAELLQLHIQFEKNRWQAGLMEDLEAELIQLYKLLGEVTLDQLFPRERWMDAVWPVIQTMNRSGMEARVLADISAGVLVQLESLQEWLSTGLNEDEFRQTVQQSLAMHDIRRLILHQVCQSDFYARFIIDILYRGIKNFWFGQNFITSNVPGASTLFDMGRNLISKVPGLDEKQMDEKVRAFLTQNLKHTLQDSESILNEALADDMADRLADEMWQWLQSEQPGGLAQSLANQNLQPFIDLQLGMLDRFRQSRLASEAFRLLLDNVYDRYGGLPCQALAHELGITETVFREQVRDLVLAFITTPAVQNWLESRVEARLTEFYTSPELQSFWSA